MRNGLLRKRLLYAKLGKRGISLQTQQEKNINDYKAKLP